VAAAGWSLPAQAAPVSGSTTLDIVFTPANVNDCLAGPGFEPCKIDKILVKLEADLVLTLSVSGVDITSTSVFTFKGLEFQSFTFTGTVGALAFRSVLIFAPNIVEVQVVRDAFGRARYCINASDPALPAFNACPTPDSDLWFLLEDIIHPVVGNLILASIFDLAGHLDPALTFRKKIAELSLSLAGLTIGLHGMFANIGSAQTPKWRMGVVASVEGQTVSGITIRGETWIGALQGLECFGECKPLEVIRGGKIYDDGDDVEDDFVITEEKLFIRNLKIAGVTLGARMEFSFVPAVGLAYLELTQDFTLAPFGLSINNVMSVMGPNLTLVADTITTNLKIGDMAMVASFYIRPAATGAFNIYFAQLITTFDAPGMKVTDVLLPCLDEVNCGGVSILDHQLNLSTTVGDVSFDVTLYFADLFRGFYQADVIVGWKIGNTTITSTTIVGENALLGQKFSFGFSF